MLFFLNTEHIALHHIPAGVSCDFFLATSGPQPVMPKSLYLCFSRAGRLVFVYEDSALVKTCHHWEEHRATVAFALNVSSTGSNLGVWPCKIMGVYLEMAFIPGCILAFQPAGKGNWDVET